MKKYVYVVSEHFIDYGEESFNVWVFDSNIKAQKHLTSKVDEFEREHSTEDMEVSHDTNSYECYNEGFYMEFHYWITIDKREVL